ncbi:hypothetical protein SSBR45G_39520 [Bradyrhizobium sp. SSBR45G]|uniref:hypothetical protein n=1 Tax=unclassified Bradyrhizobium TaxID=2631580 RepID=UPI002342B5C2|nr:MULTISPECIES: hypothetical protein [unclassified Bradyrhizobium]GLH79043.1 hypothetical protein SSBR45G_39520 [Bradyrhizobium sp. SSBR45G]
MIETSLTTVLLDDAPPPEELSDVLPAELVADDDDVAEVEEVAVVAWDDVVAMGVVTELIDMGLSHQERAGAARERGSLLQRSFRAKLARRVASEYVRMLRSTREAESKTTRGSDQARARHVALAPHSHRGSPGSHGTPTAALAFCAPGNDGGERGGRLPSAGAAL